MKDRIRGLHVQTIQVNLATYEQRYAICGKKTCWCSWAFRDPQHPDPGHGPYWYRVVKKGKLVIRRYIGKDLVTDGGQSTVEFKGSKP